MERYGIFVTTRGDHSLASLAEFWIGETLVSNEFFLGFVRSGGYSHEGFWLTHQNSRNGFLTRDGCTQGPAHWKNSGEVPSGQNDHPVCGISFVEALAFVSWCNETLTLDSGMSWALPLEDEWELAARTESGLTYPWGDAFDVLKCNSAESGFGHATSVIAYRLGASRIGCCDMAGNLWEYVMASGVDPDLCVLKGGSYKNNRYEVRSYLRLTDVPVTHRPADFGFRLVHRQAARAQKTQESKRPPNERR